MKVRWISKAGKITFWVILWIIVWIFCIIGVAITWITYLQWGDLNHAPNVYEMIYNIEYDLWIWVHKENLNDSFGRYIDLEPNWEDKVIAVGDDFTQWEWEWRYFYIKLPTNSKFFNRNVQWEPIYGDETDDRWFPVAIWSRIHEIKIEVNNGSFIQSLGTPLVRNPGKDHFWQRNAWMVDWPERSSYNTPKPEEWETMCVILTPQNPITQTEISLHDEWCEFWSLPKADDYDEMYLHLIIAGTGENPNSNIKVSHIIVDLPIYK